ncbi:hypothetical protein NSK_007548 [Nannochloropsis salina CCMP1776]|uniref:Ketopantoate reductase N-terminal domain-containing protein n=1 Tax=Nannochloropsis salina CCMP1776 TaxID=1027361 RepID=A0A4D9CX64_9STRA|nr:hypothetical protein NSK_007548 [Nannochloropsis salina CCMP1776]|eukprot:TFJ81118.1 hypothetical protein NSK_007548 [Nannochloropsis salina CCMP1776]
MGCLVAAALSEKAKAKVTLLTRRSPPSPMATVQVKKSYPDIPPVFSSSFSSSSSPSSPSSSSPSSPTGKSYAATLPLQSSQTEEGGEAPGIKYLLMLTKAYDFKKALRQIFPRLTAESVVVVLSNGMGWEEEAKEVLREGGKEGGREGGPTLVLGSVTHAPVDMRRRLWLKFGANCIINPLTLLLHCRNGAVLEGGREGGREGGLGELILALCEETAQVAKALAKETSGSPTPPCPSPTAGELEAFTVKVAAATAWNESSMLRDGRAGGRRGGGRRSST